MYTGIYTLIWCEWVNLMILWINLLLLFVWLWLTKVWKIFHLCFQSWFFFWVELNCLVIFIVQLTDQESVFLADQLIISTRKCGNVFNMAWFYSDMLILFGKDLCCD